MADYVIDYYDDSGHYSVGYSGEPSGKKVITGTQETNVTDYATAQVMDTQLIPENIRKDREILGVLGEYEGTSPSGTIDIDANGTYDVTEVATAIVDVPQPPQPSGKKLITTTDETDVTDYATAQVSDDNLLPENIVDGKTILGVEGIYAGIIPSGTKNLTDTSLTDVASYASAQIVDDNLIPENIAKDVTVLGITGTHEGGIVPTGTINITENGTYDVTEKASAVVNVEADQLLGYITTLSNNPFSGVTLPQKVKCNFTNLTTAERIFMGASGVEEADITIPNDLSIARILRECASIKKIKIRPSPYRVTTNGGTYMSFYTANALEEIDCEFDLSGTAEGLGNYSFSAPKLKTVRFVPNSISACHNNPIAFGCSDAVIIACANGLNINAPSTFGSLDVRLKTQMNTIMGDVDSDNLFVANPSGTMSLTQFITNVKGWTIS